MFSPISFAWCTSKKEKKEKRGVTNITPAAERQKIRLRIRVLTRDAREPTPNGEFIMAIWKEQPAPPKEPAVSSMDQSSQSARKEFEPRPEPRPELYSSSTAQARVPDRAAKESLIAEEITIEGKIEGSGHVRIAGRFKGDVHVKGNLAIEPGATLTGGVRANTVTIGGQLEGNIDGAIRVELLETGILNGDLSADSLTVAAGSRMRGKVEFGWEKKDTRGLSSGKPTPPIAQRKLESEHAGKLESEPAA